MILTYTVTLQQANASGQADGFAFTFTGVQSFGGGNPQAADLTALTNAMSADVNAKLQAGYPVQNAVDSANAGSGGAG